MRTQLLLLLLLTFTACADPAPGDAAPDAGADLAPDLTVEDSAPDLPPAKALGATCTSDDQCAGGRCLLHPTWPSGYCTLPDCGAGCDAAGGVCLSVRDGEPTCAKYCASVGECRFGYVCHRDWDTFDTGCLPQPLVPAPPVVEQPLDGLPDGAPCAGDEACAGGTCLMGEAWPDGFCTTLGCTSDDQCSRRASDPPARCLQLQDPADKACVTPCARSADCRAGYMCARDTLGVALCGRETPFAEVLGADPVQTYGLTCAQTSHGAATIQYDVAAATTAHSITVISPRGQPVGLDKLETPLATFNTSVDYRQWVDVSSYGNPWLRTLVLPGLPQYKDRHGPGSHALTVYTLDADVCWRVDEKDTRGESLHVNIFVVGRPQLTTLDELPGLSALLGYTEAIFQGYDIRLVPRLSTLPDEAHTLYAYLRRDSDFDELAQAAGSARQEPLSINLFLVSGFANPYLLGRAGALPGPPGLHGLPVSGVFASYGGLGRDEARDRLTALTIVHEIGHYLGLRHTTEGNGSPGDDLQDTPSCPRIYAQHSSRCPDRGNLMFPSATTYNATILTPNQRASISDNPLIRP